MLRTPRRELPVDLDLAGQNALDAPLESAPGRRAAIGVDESKVVRAGDISQELEDVDHRPVVEGDVPVVTWGAGRVVLGKPAVRILSSQSQVEPFEEGIAIAQARRSPETRGQEPKLAEGRTVVESPCDLRAIALVRVFSRC